MEGEPNARSPIGFAVDDLRDTRAKYSGDPLFLQVQITRVWH